MNCSSDSSPAGAETNASQPQTAAQTPNSRPSRPRREQNFSWPAFILGGTGRTALRWFARRVDQASFLGRLHLIGLRGLRGSAAQRRLVRKLTLVEVMEIHRRSIIPLSLFGLMMGVLWTVIWFDVLDNVPGSSMLASLLINVHLKEITPILATMALIMTYCGPMTSDLAIRKCSGEFNVLFSMGISPEHLLGWPRLIAVMLSFPGLMLIINLATIAGAYWGIARAIDLPLVEFIDDLYLSIEPYQLFMIFVKMALISAVIGFCCLYYAFQARVGDFNKVPFLTRRGMVEAFFYSTTAEVLVTVLYG